MLHKKISRWFSGKNNRSNKGSQNKGAQKRSLRLEALEERQLLAVTVTEFNQIRAMYSDLNLSANMGDYNVIEITTSQLTDANLRNAITQAGTTTANDLIVVRTTTTQNTITLSGTELAININATTNGSVTIVSFGTAKLTIDANKQSRVFNISSNYSAVAFAGLTITGGKDTTGNGGGIYNTGMNSTLAITSCIISGNTSTSGWGGGISCNGTNSTLTITDSIISGNSAYVGGGIFCSGLNSALTITESIISGNSVNGSGGGIFSNSPLILTNCTVTENTADYNAAGIYCGTLTLTDCTISGNTAENAGGGIYGTGKNSVLTITGSTISGNTANLGGGIYSDAGTMTVTDCTIAGNTSDAGGGICNIDGTLTAMGSTISGNITYGGDGGGIYNYDGTMTLTNCTISENSAVSGYYGTGGGIYNNSYSGTLTLTNCTVTENTAHIGGGIANLFNSTLKLYNTIVANNTAYIAGFGYDVFSIFDVVGANNLIGIDSGMNGLINGVSGNIIGTTSTPVDPMLGPLQDNGGKTWTHALLSGSPAINNGSNTYAVGLPYDQRGSGFVRVFGGTVDIGAYEYQGAAPGMSSSQITLNNAAQPLAGFPGLPTNDSEYFVTKLDRRTTSLANPDDVIFALEEAESATLDFQAFSSDTKTVDLNLTITETVDLDFVTAMFAQRQFHSRKMRI